MKLRTNLVLLLLAAALVVLVLLDRQSVRFGEKDRPKRVTLLPPFSEEDIIQIILEDYEDGFGPMEEEPREKELRRVILSKQTLVGFFGGRTELWHVESSSNYPADLEAIKELFQTFKSAETGELVALTEAYHDKYEVTGDKAKRVVLKSFYVSGTVNVRQGNPKVTGNGTRWLAEVRPGDTFRIPRQTDEFVIEEVVSDTEIVLRTPYTGQAAQGMNYFILSTFADLFIGKSGPGGNNAYVRKAAGPEVLLVDDIKPYEFAADSHRWLKKKVLEFEVDDIVTVSLQGAEQEDEARLKKDGEGDWHFAKPQDLPCDSAETANLVKAIHNLILSDVPSQNVPASEYGLDTPSGSIRLFQKFPFPDPRSREERIMEVCRLERGKTDDEKNHSYVRALRIDPDAPEGKEWFLEISKYDAENCFKGAGELVDRKLLDTFVSSAVSEVELRAGEELLLHVVQVEKQEGPEEWQVQAPAGLPLDVDRLDALLNSLSGLRASTTELSRTPAECGLEPPERTVTLRFPKAFSEMPELVALRIGSKDDKERYYLMVEGEELIRLVNSLKLREVTGELTEWAAKTVWRADPGELQLVAVTRAGASFRLQRTDEGWQLAVGGEEPEEGPARQEEVDMFLRSLCDLNAKEAAALLKPDAPDPRTEYGLLEPLARFELWREEGATRMRLGAVGEEDDRKWYFEVEGQPVIYELDAFDAGDLDVEAEYFREPDEEGPEEPGERVPPEDLRPPGPADDE